MKRNSSSVFISNTELQFRSTELQFRSTELQFLSYIVETTGSRKKNDTFFCV